MGSKEETVSSTTESKTELSREDLEVCRKFTGLLSKLQLTQTRETFIKEFSTMYAGSVCDQAASVDAATVSLMTSSRERDDAAPDTAAAESGQPNESTAPSAAKPSETGVDGIEIWDPSELGIHTVPGTEDELWECEDFANSASPSYERGAGITAAEYEQLRRSEVKMVQCKPYQKEKPPSSLPLESFDMRIIYEAGKTGFEGVKDFPIVVGSVIAGRYQVQEYLGSAAFSRVVQCVDLKYGHEVCVKIIRNSKDFFDQAIDEIKLLQFINSGKDPDEVHILQLYDYFYFKEHVFLVCELLRDNLYEFAKFNREEESETYFTMPRMQSIARQVLQALAYIHSLKLLHCDLKPENILIKSYSRSEVKLIDFGSSCFTSDMLSSYIQSRCYRAPEVILGCKYDGRIDVWSLGAILPELLTGKVVFHCDTVPGMLARMSAILGPFPASMLYSGRHTCRFVTKHGVFFEREADTQQLLFHFPRRTQLRQFLGSDDPLFSDFVSKCLTIDNTKRPTAQALLAHPWLAHNYAPPASLPVTTQSPIAKGPPKTSAKPSSEVQSTHPPALGKAKHGGTAKHSASSKGA